MAYINNAIYDVFNMAATMIESTKEEQRSVIRFLWSGGVKTGEIYGKMKVQYGDSCISQRKVQLMGGKIHRTTSTRDSFPGGKAAGM